MSKNTRPKPFLKWAGNKHKLLDNIEEAFGQNWPGLTLVDPFCGSASTFIGTNYSRYVMGDINPDLIHTYRYVAEQESFLEMIEILTHLFTDEHNTPEAYYALRDEFNALPIGNLRRSALFIYLNKFGFNGLCRYNRSGGFNVPYGRKKTPEVTSLISDMQAFHDKCNSCEVIFNLGPAENTLMLAPPRSNVYLDPPYLPLPDRNGTFTDYATDGFSIDDHRALARRCRAMAGSNDCMVVLSNHDSPLVREIYWGGAVTPINVLRSISRNGDGRGMVREVLITWPGAVYVEDEDYLTDFDREEE